MQEKEQGERYIEKVGVKYSPQRITQKNLKWQSCEFKVDPIRMFEPVKTANMKIYDAGQVDRLNKRRPESR